MLFTFAETTSVAQLCALFNSAFSDYVQPMVLTEPVMQLKLQRDGIDRALSPLALEQEEPVGFILNAAGEWQGRKTAYNGGTGVVPAARGRALTQQMYQFCIPALKNQEVEQCLLEVIQENKRALKVYKQLGFEITRSLRCFRHAKKEVTWHEHVPYEVTFVPVASPDWLLYQTFWDVEPSWQHHTSAVDRSLEFVLVLEARALGKCVGYGIVYPMTGAIAQLAVAPLWRTKGIGQALMQQLVEATTSPIISVINVDGRGDSMLRFLQERKVGEIMAQLEMIREI